MHQRAWTREDHAIVKRRWFGAATAALSALLLTACASWAAPPRVLQFEILLPVEAAAEAGIQHAVSGRLYVFLSRHGRREPRFGPDWFAPEPFFATDVHKWQPGTTRTLGSDADGFPGPLDELPAGEYYVQAILDHDFYSQHHARGVGNLYSEVRRCMLDPQSPQSVALVVDQIVRAEPFPENDYVKEVVLRSELLSRFHRREVVERAAVVLPASYAERPEARYPVVYLIPGFGGSHRDALVYAGGPPPVGEGEVEFIRVMLNGQCKWGHHVYADSATNGPRGRALVEELIPYIDRTYRTVAESTARFVSGHSSGGWSSLWLQVTYPETFGGVWSTSPDPVDFRDYQQVNLYADPPLSLYYDEQGHRRPIARRGTQPVLWYDAFGKMDDVLGRGGQLRSFEAVFSPLDEHGLPRRLWDRRTGRIDPEVARAWQAYDIRLRIERNWETLGPKLAGKLHIVTGELDTFYLEGAVIKLAESLRALGSDAQIEVVPGKDHGSVLTPELVRRMRREMSQAYVKYHGDQTHHAE